MGTEYTGRRYVYSTYVDIGRIFNPKVNSLLAARIYIRVFMMLGRPLNRPTPASPIIDTLFSTELLNGGGDLF